MKITKGQVEQIWNKYHVNPYGMSFANMLAGDPGIIYDLVAMHRGKPVTTDEQISGDDMLEAYKHFFMEDATGNGQVQSAITGEPAPANS